VPEHDDLPTAQGLGGFDECSRTGRDGRYERVLGQCMRGKDGGWVWFGYHTRPGMDEYV